MTGRVDVERILDAFLAPEADQLPDRVIEASVSEIARTPQRHALRVPWRFRLMTPQLRLASTALVAVVVAGGLIYVLAPKDSPGPSGPTQSNATGATASPIVTSAPASAPATSLGSVDTSTWLPFTSPRLGISARFPEGWDVTTATIPWVWQQNDPGPPNGGTDLAIGDNRQAFQIDSQKLPDGLSPDAWWADYTAQGGPVPWCFPSSRAGYEAVTVDGQPGYVHGNQDGCSFTEAVVVTGGRAYQLTALLDIDAARQGVFDRTMFDAWLSTVHFNPATADDRAFRVPTLGATFRSSLHAYSVRYPKGWTATPATQAWTTSTGPTWGDPALDSIQTGDVRFVAASQPLGSQTAGAWRTAQRAAVPTCTGSSTLDFNVPIDGENGVVTRNGCSAAGGSIKPGGVVFDVIVVHGDRGYDFRIDGHVNAEYVLEILGSITFD